METNAAYTHQVFTRRAFLRLGLAATGAGLGLVSGIAAPLLRVPFLPESLAYAAPVTAEQFAETEANLSAAQARYEEVQAEIERIATEYEALCIAQNETMDAIEEKRATIDSVQSLIDLKDNEYEERQQQLADYLVATYKNADPTYLDVLFDSTSFVDFVSNVHNVKAIVNKKELILEQLDETRGELEDHRAVLEREMSDLEELQTRQSEQQAKLTAKQNELLPLLDSLDEDVRALTDKYNEELAERARAEELARQSAGYAHSYAGEGSANAVINACYSTPSPGGGLCAAWVSSVIANAGIGFWNGNACDLYNNYCWSSDPAQLQPGMIIAVSTHNHNTAGRIYGHVGIYVGNNTVRENIGYIATTPLDEWISWYGTTVDVRWGWLGGVALE